MKKLVKVDENLALTEIDWKPTRRQAEKLRTYIENAPESERDKYEYDTLIMPLINGVLDSSLDVPYYGNDPYNFRSISEGWSPQLVRSFQDLYSPFFLMIGGDVGKFSLSTHETGEYVFGKYRVEKDGELCEWCWFED